MVAAAHPAPFATIIARPAVLSMQAPRLVSVDILRGLVMVIMALDHTRDFLTYLRFAPEDMAHTYGALFFTRFITHFCAPVFAFLAGTGAFLSTQPRKVDCHSSPASFLPAGLWLVLLELTVVDFAWGFVPWAQGGVIWILGWSMVAMALIVRLPAALDRGPGIGHDCHSQPARPHQSRRRSDASTGYGCCCIRRDAFRSRLNFRSR